MRRYQKQAVQHIAILPEYDLLKMQANYDSMAHSYSKYLKTITRITYCVIAAGLSIAGMVLFL